MSGAMSLPPLCAFLTSTKTAIIKLYFLTVLLDMLHEAVESPDTAWSLGNKVARSSSVLIRAVCQRKGQYKAS